MVLDMGCWEDSFLSLTGWSYRRLMERSVVPTGRFTAWFSCRPLSYRQPPHRRMIDPRLVFSSKCILLVISLTIPASTPSPGPLSSSSRLRDGWIPGRRRVVGLDMTGEGIVLTEEVVLWIAWRRLTCNIEEESARQLPKT